MKKRKQHYVPKLYLKNFTKNNFFNVYNIEKDELINNVHYASQCQEKYYYGEDCKWEDLLGTYESEWGRLFKQIIGDDKYVMSEYDKNLIKQFAIIQSIRTPAREKYYKEITWGSLKFALEMRLNKKNIQISPYLIEKERENFEKKYMQNIPQQNLEDYNKMIKYINDLSVCILEYTCTTKLISSDNPIIKYNNFVRENNGLQNAGFVMFFPISSNKLIVLFDGKMYKRYDDEKYYKINNDKEVEEINAFLYVSADKIVFSEDEKYDFQRKMKKYKIKREEYTEFMKPQSFGTKFDKYITISEPMISLEYDFSFCKLIGKAKSFEFPELDWFPRSEQKEYIERINTKKLIVKSGVVGKMNEINMKKLKKFNIFIKDYWENKL